MSLNSTSMIWSIVNLEEQRSHCRE